jgi:hypothetical protein
MKIKLYQDLYERYSHLALSYNTDRPIAIKGLETRLIRTFETIGGHGIFESYLHRGLMWQRSGGTLKRITSFRGERVPSWSWMAYDGGIKYMDIPLGGAIWAEEKDMTSPFKATSEDSPEVGGKNRLEALVHGIVEAQNRKLIMDEPGRDFAQPFKCVIVGRSKQAEGEDNQIHYAIIVSFVTREGVEVYERVGVGFLERRHIMLGDRGTKVHVQ